MLKLLRQVWRSARRWSEPWYLAFALLGLTTGGIAGILLPLGISRFSDADDIGVIMGAIAAAQLTAGIWGTLSDRRRWHRQLFVLGALLVLLAFLGFASTRGVLPWLGIALVLGLGTAATNTLANLFVIERHARAEWDERIGWLQTIYNGGAVAGTLIAGALTDVDVRTGLLIAAAVTAAAVLGAWFTIKAPPEARAGAPRPGSGARASLHERPLARLKAIPHSGVFRIQPVHLLHAPTPRTFAALASVLRTRFGLFLAIWLLSTLGMAGIYTLYPLLMLHVYAIKPDSSSLLLATETALGLGLYTVSSKLETHVGAVRVLQAGLGTRLAGLAALAALGLGGVPNSAWLASAAFVVAVLAGSAVSVSGTVLASYLCGGAEGEGQGIFTTVNALAGLLGSVAAGLVAENAGYNAATLLAGGGVALGLLLSASLPISATAPPVAPQR